MPADALAVLQILARRLGRQPTLCELYGELGVPPSGEPLLPSAALLPGEPTDEELTLRLQTREMMAMNPEIGRVRDEFIRQLLFGDFLGGAPDPSYLGQPRHGQQGGKPFHLGPHATTGTFS